MSFFFDCRFIRVDHHDGISRFSSELFAAVANKVSVTALICDLDQLRELPPGIDHLVVNDPKNPWLELLLPRILNRHGASIVFSPMQTMGSLGKKYRLILTLHDLIYYKHRKPPESLAWPIRLVWRLFHLSFIPVRILLNRSEAVVTISETTRGLIESKHLTRRPVHVVYNASSMPTVNSAKTAPKSRNLVYMGSYMPYKNVEVLIRAMEELTEYTLILCSKIEPKRKAQLLSESTPAASSRIRFMDGTSEAEYLQILDESFALVTASKDEGFGIPVVEAMSRSIPVVIADIPIFREVASTAGIFFNPTSPAEFAAAVKNLEAQEAWKLASQKSLDRAKSFDWDDSANKLLASIETANR
jgi:glycosyltransferase involved in cell wall biosynthesis